MRNLSQAQADCFGALVIIALMIALCLWFSSCSIPRQPDGYRPDDVRWAVEGFSSSYNEVLIVPECSDNQTIYLLDEDEYYDWGNKVQPDTTPCNHDKHMVTDGGGWSQCMDCGEQWWYYPSETVTYLPPKPCDHFYVKQSTPIESPLSAFDMDYMPCICIHCHDLNVCK